MTTPERRRSTVAILGIGISAIFGWSAMAQQAAQPTAPPRLPGYLGPARVPDAAKVILPPPVEGGDRQKSDLAVFKATRALQGTPRWALAQNDVDYSPPALMRQFGCAVGVSLDTTNAPRLNVLLRRMLVDSGSTSENAKQLFLRKRPYLLTEGEICVAKTDALAASLDYPSGHSTLGFTAGLILSEISPDRSTAIMARARAYGDSRVVCGVHTVSAIEGGRATGGALYAALHASDEFRSDVEAARKEIEAVRTAGKVPPAATCATEAALIAQAPF